MELNENAVVTFLTKFKASGRSTTQTSDHLLTLPLDNDKRVDQVQMFGLQLESTSSARDLLHGDDEADGIAPRDHA